MPSTLQAILTRSVVTREDALRIARQECARRGWPAVPAPSDVKWRLLTYRIVAPNDGYGFESRGRPRTHAEFVSITVDAFSGRVRKSFVFSRAVKAGGRDDTAGGSAAAGRPVRPRSGPPSRTAADAKPLPKCTAPTRPSP